MALAGLGCDIIEIDRIKRSCESSHRFLDKVFTCQELEYCTSQKLRYQHLAGRFAAKEAVGKAIGCSLNWLDVEITRSESGKPSVTLHGKAKEIAGHMKITISISHSRGNAMAVALLEDS